MSGLGTQSKQQYAEHPYTVQRLPTVLVVLKGSVFEVVWRRTRSEVEDVSLNSLILFSWHSSRIKEAASKPQPLSTVLEVCQIESRRLRGYEVMLSV